MHVPVATTHVVGGSAIEGSGSVGSAGGGSSGGPWSAIAGWGSVGSADAGDGGGAIGGLGGMLLVVGSENLDVIPLGQLLCELTPGLLVPLGMDVVPRVSPEVISRALGHQAGVITVFTPDGRPFQDSEMLTVRKLAGARQD